MRECLGWITNCPDDRRCPQNWLELAVSELPTNVYCHICEQDIALVLTEGEFNETAATQLISAWPVVPCAGSSAAQMDDLRELPAAPPERANGASAAARPMTSAPPKQLFCVLTNGETIKVDKETMIIGRSRTCDIVIQSAKVSRQHASLTRQDGDYYIEDLGSANGVWKNGEKVGRTKVEDGDVYTISEETLTFQAR